MASRRPGPHVFGWSGSTAPRDRRAAADTPKEDAKFNARWDPARGTEASHRQPARAIPQPTSSSRMPQALSHRRPSDSKTEQPRLGHQPRVRSSVGSASSLVVGGADRPPSSASGSSRLPAPSLRPRNVLRRKRSGLSQDAGSTRNDSRNESTSSDSYPRSQTPLDALDLDRDLTQSPMEIRVAQQVEIPWTTAHAVTIYPELDRYRNVKPPAGTESPGSNVPYRIATHDLPPPTPLFSGTSSQLSGFSGSPSTGWSESPGPGPYSRDTTPTSMSSQSPGSVAPIRIPAPGARARQADPGQTRPPVTRKRTGSISNGVASVTTEHYGLAAVRELSTSSSSNSTVRADGTKEGKQSKEPPQPPPRKSSHRAKESGEEVVSAFKPFRKPAQPQVASPSPWKATSYSRTLPVQATHATAAAKPTPPVRPSRDGTADLHAQLGRPLPVVHSNLSSASLSERQQSGLLVPGPASKPALASSLPDRPSYLSRRPPTREPTPAPKPATSGHVADKSKRATGRAARTPSPGVSSTFKSRFPIFGRRTKTVPEPSQRDKQEKSAARKGPAAGTGHEGYGRLGAVRRRSSVTNSARVIPGTMSSQESLSSSHSQDPFLMERMAPVIIAGGEVIENRNTSSDLTRTESNQSSAQRRPSIESRNSSQISLSSREAPRGTLWPSPLPRDSTQTPPLGSRRPSESSDSETLMEPTLTLRRSMRRLKSREREPPSLPKPIVARVHVVSPSTASLDASIMSDDSIFDSSAEPAVASKEPTGAAALPGRKKLVRRPRSPRKWNLFSRSQSQPPEKKKDPAQTVAATVKVVQSKPLAFYTMMDSSEQEDPEPLDLEEVLREARAVAATPEQLSGQSSTEDAEVRRPLVTQDLTPSQTPGSGRDHQPSTGPKSAVPSPATLLPVPSAEPRPAPTPTQQPEGQPAPPRQTTSRPSRLPQVGRIPKVVSARADQISPRSFSRPFHRLSVQAPPVTADLQDMKSVAKGPSPPKPSTPEPPYEEPMAPNASNISALIYGVPRLPPPVPSQPGHEFLSFSPRKNSQCTTTTTSSSSSGGLLSYADATAIVPDPNTPLAEDEIWDEYNDLLGEDTIRLSTFAGPYLPGPLRVGGSAQGNGGWIEPALESPTLNPPSLPSLVHALRSGMEHPSLSVRGSDIAEEVKRMLDGGLAPANATTVVNSLSGGNSQTQSLDVGTQTEESGSPAQRDSNSSAHQVRCSDASGSSQGSEDSSPLSQVNLRVGSMTVSKWLTFGHVLFSPVRDELVTVVGSLKRPSILVVDGLGNDDWSFYAAETYPAATFFNLSPRAPLPAEHRTSESSFPLSPPNHHQVQYRSHMDKFPFGAQSFTAVVFRFPAAAPEGHYRNIISEARRVLKPGGYIELSILDVDLNNMGNRCRRTVRRLKERIHARAPNTSLASASDLVLRLIGRRGFSDIKTCRVGVPVASTIARNNNANNTSAAGSRMGGGASGKSSSSAGGVSAGEQDGESTKPFSRKKRDERSLPEMMDDESAVADESIAKSVARVGRWWYSRCYESAAGPSGSMWRDRALLAECEEWGTSLKLMVCHARVPDGRGRVASI